MFVLDKNSKTYYSNRNLKDVIHGFGTKDTPSLSSFLDFDTYVNVEQVHEHSIGIIDKKPYAKRIEFAKTDGVITDQPKVLLSTKSADCVPIIFADTSKNIIGISHQGWKGTLLKLPQKMVSQFSILNSQPSTLCAVIGPSVGACCYTIDAARRNSFRYTFPEWEGKVFEDYSGETHLNLGYLNYLQLIEAGVKREHVDFFPFCTKCEKEKFWSYRRGDRDKVMVNFIMMV